MIPIGNACDDALCMFRLMCYAMATFVVVYVIVDWQIVKEQLRSPVSEQTNGVLVVLITLSAVLLCWIITILVASPLGLMPT